MKALFRTTSLYGIVAGLLGSALLIGLYFLGRHPLMISPFLDFRILLFGVFIFFCLKEFRDNEQNGILYLWQGIVGSLTLVASASLVAAVVLQIFGSLNSEFVPSYIGLMKGYLKSFPQHDIDLIGKEVYERNLKALTNTNISKLSLTYFVQGLGIGLFVSIILSVILRRQPKS